MVNRFRRLRLTRAMRIACSWLLLVILMGRTRSAVSFDPLTEGRRLKRCSTKMRTPAPRMYSSIHRIRTWHMLRFGKPGRVRGRTPPGTERAVAYSNPLMAAKRGEGLARDFPRE